MKIYQENIDRYSAKARQLKKVINGMSWLRLLIFIISSTIVIALFSADFDSIAWIVLIVAILCFAFVLKYQDKVSYLREHTLFLKKINEFEIQRDQCNLEQFDTGQKFIDHAHPYTSDLDIFGHHSIFQLVNRTTTESGMILLSEWLSEPAANGEIQDRQKAITELSQKMEWMQDFQASGMHFQNNKSDYYKLLEWVESPVVLLKHRGLYLAGAVLLSVLSLLGLYLVFVSLNSTNRFAIHLSFLIGVLFVNYMILRKIRKPAEDIVETSTRNLSTLKGYQTLIGKIENENFESKKLSELQSLLVQGEYSAYKEIRSICTLLDFSHQRPIEKIPIGGNYLYPILNSFFLLDIYLILGAEKWKSKNKVSLTSWAKIVSEFEVVNSFAGFYYSNPSFTFPEITTENNYVHFELLGHPLIPSEQRVCNDFHSEKQGRIVMVTGSNMGGKSTFLRTVGVNLVLSLAGAPCCARYGQLSNLKIFTSMRTQDNLMKGVSSFYAELNRIEKMLNLIKNGENIYFLLDEMFKGTNSEDRHRGGFSLIHQLSKLNTSGIIATHDIELAKLAERKKLVSNYSFNSEIKENSMIFSYKLHPEICNDFNASELMEKSGIEIISDLND